MSNISFSKNVSLLESLQVNLDETATREGIYVVRSLIKVAKEAILGLVQGKLNQFDALCSDMACQVRAIRIALLAKQLLANKDLLNQIATALQDMMKKLHLRFQKMNLVGFKLKGSLKDNVSDCDVLIPEELIYFVRCALLTITKQEHPIKVCCPCHKQLVEMSKDKSQPAFARISVSSKSIRSSKIDADLLTIIEKTKAIVSEISCKEMISQLQGHVLTNKKLMKEINVNKRVELPCFLTVQGALQIASEKNIRLLIKSMKASHTVLLKKKDPVDVQLLYSLTSIQGQITSKLISLEDVEEEEPLIVIEGQRYGKEETTQEYAKRLTEANIVDVILQNAARHNQYSDEKGDKELVLEEDSDIKNLVTHLTNLSIEADKNGCSMVDQSLFRIVHIYSNTLKGEKK